MKNDERWWKPYKKQATSVFLSLELELLPVLGLYPPRFFFGTSSSFHVDFPASQVEFQSRSQISKVLQSHRDEQLVITTSEPGVCKRWESLLGVLVGFGRTFWDKNWGFWVDIGPVKR